MEYTRLGSTGLQVSRVCLGMMSYGAPSWRDWVLDRAAAAMPLVRQAVEQGVMFFDTADMHSRGVGEEVTGSLLGELFAKRDDYALATKVFMPTGEGPNDRGLSRKHILSSIDNSLRRLGTDHVDLYQIHRWDPDTPIEETMEELHDVVRAGKARYLGRRAGTPGSSRRPSTSPTGAAGRGSSRCRITTTCSTARSGRCTRSVLTRASG